MLVLSEKRKIHKVNDDDDSKILVKLPCHLQNVHLFLVEIVQLTATLVVDVHVNKPRCQHQCKLKRHVHCLTHQVQLRVKYMTCDAQTHSNCNVFYIKHEPDAAKYDYDVASVK